MWFDISVYLWIVIKKKKKSLKNLEYFLVNKKLKYYNPKIKAFFHNSNPKYTQRPLCEFTKVLAYKGKPKRPNIYCLRKLLTHV